MKIHVISSLVITAVLTLAYSNCTPAKFSDDSQLQNIILQETVTGNPLTAAAKTLVTQACSVVTRCHSQVSQSQCEAGFQDVANVDYQVGLPKGSNLKLSEIIQSESAGSLVANRSGFDSCLSAFEKLSCSDSSVQGAYDPSAQDPFASMAHMIPTSPGSCPSVFNQPPARREFYVSTSGSDSNDGSIKKPWATITHAAQALTVGADGAIVHVAPGTYQLPVLPACDKDGGSCGIKTTRSGSLKAPVEYISDQQWGAKLIAPAAESVWYNSGHHVRIIGFEVIGSASSNNGIKSEGSFGQIVGNHIHSIPAATGCSAGTGGAGVRFSWHPGSTDNDAIGNLIHDIGPLPANGLPDSSYCDSLVHGISYAQPRGKVQNNIVYRVSTWGISTTRSASNMVISHNLVFNNGSRTGTGRVLGGGILVSAQTSPHDNTTVSNNIVRNNSGHSISEWDSVGSRNVYFNNVDYANGILIQVFGGGVKSGTITSDPQMISFNANGGGNYQLRASSPAIDAGSSSCSPGVSSCALENDFKGFTRPFGAGLDIGPHEWHP